MILASATYRHLPGVMRQLGPFERLTRRFSVANSPLMALILPINGGKSRICQINGCSTQKNDLNVTSGRILVTNKKVEGQALWKKTWWPRSNRRKTGCQTSDTHTQVSGAMPLSAVSFSFVKSLLISLSRGCNTNSGSTVVGGPTSPPRGPGHQTAANRRLSCRVQSKHSWSSGPLSFWQLALSRKHQWTICQWSWMSLCPTAKCNCLSGSAFLADPILNRRSGKNASIYKISQQFKTIEAIPC